MKLFYKKFLYASFRLFVLTFILIFTSFAIIKTLNTFAQTNHDFLLEGTVDSLTIPSQSSMLIGITLSPENPLLMDFMIDPGSQDLDDDLFKQEAEKLIKYFLTSLTVPENEMWVNLSPYEKDRIIPEGLGSTEMGRDLLKQDYLLKQVASTLMSPDDPAGSAFWKRIYSKVQREYGTTEIPINTFNKIWIVPESANVHVEGNSVFVVSSHLKVMLEEDYLALGKKMDITKHEMRSVHEEDVKALSDLSSEIMRKILIPEIEEEVNKGKTFFNLKQIFNSMILAAWYKQNLKNSFLGMVYADQNKTIGIDLENKDVKKEIYELYVEMFNDGVFSLIKEDYDIMSQEIIPRRYFSGGISGEITDIIGKKPFDVARLSKTKTARTMLDGKGGDENIDSIFKGSPAKLLETVQANAGLLNHLMGAGGITVSEIVPHRKKNESDDNYHIDTVRKELEILREVGVLRQIRGRYYFTDLIRNKIVADGNTEIIGKITNIEYQVGRRGEARPLHRYNIPKDKRPIVGELIIDVIKPTGDFPIVVDTYDVNQINLSVEFNREYSGRFVFDRKKGKTFIDGEAIRLENKNNPIEWHVDALVGAIEQDPKYKKVTSYAHGNFMMNEWFLIYDGGSRKVYHRQGEPIFNRIYSMLVIWQDGKVSSENITFKKSEVNGEVQIILDSKNNGRIAEIKTAFFGQRILENGGVTPLSKLYNQFDDLFHLFIFPQFMEESDGKISYGESIGERELFVDLPYENNFVDRNLLRTVLANDGFLDLDIKDYLLRHSQEDIRMKALNSRGYSEKFTDGDLIEGEYRISGNQLQVRLIKSKYPHNLIGITESGNIVMFNFTGNKKQGAGYTISELQEIIILKNAARSDPLVHVFMLANSRDVFKRVNGKMISKESSSNPRSHHSAVIVVAQRKNGADASLNKISDTSIDSNTLGGIDLNPSILNLQSDNIIQFEIPIDQLEIKNIKINGFAPIILEIFPTDVPQLIIKNNILKNSQLSQL